MAVHYYDTDMGSAITDEVDRLLGKFVRTRAASRAAQRGVRQAATHVERSGGQCPCCREALHGFVCWTAGCIGSVHAATDTRWKADGTVTFVTEGVPAE